MIREVTSCARIASLLLLNACGGSSPTGVTPEPVPRLAFRGAGLPGWFGRHLFSHVRGCRVRRRERMGEQSVPSHHWKNGAQVRLADGTRNAVVRDLQVFGGSVYAVGSEPNGTHNVAKIWKDGVSTSLSSGLAEAQARAISIILN